MRKIYLNIFEKFFISVMLVFTTKFCFSQPAVDWCNLQWPPYDTIVTGTAYNVYAQVYEPGITDVAGQGTNISAWIGYNTVDTNPSTWTNWVAASYNTDAGNNDEYMAEIASALPAGIYYYASRFIISGGNYQYGGFNGGFWDGINNVSGVLLVTDTTPIAVDWCNLQWPTSSAVCKGTVYTVYAHVYELGITEPPGQGGGITAWIGYYNTDTDPSGWTNWVLATYNIDAGNNDEYKADLNLPAGIYYYASRFEYNFVFSYGGYNAGGGGFWDGVTNVNQVLTVNSLPTVGAGVDQTVCSGTSVTLSGSGALTYTWDNGITDGTPFTALTTTTYTVTGTDATGCTNTDSVYIAVHPIPFVDIGNDQVLCIGDSVTLTANPATFTSYNWSSGDTTTSINVNSSGIYSLTVTESSGCTGFDVVSIDFVEPPVAGFSYSTTGLTVYFSDTSNGGTSYSWDFNGNGIPESTVAGDVTYTYALPGQYNVILIVTNGCSSDTSNQTIFVSTGIEENLSDIVCTVFPNPTPDNITINIENSDALKWTLEIYNIHENKLYTTSFIRQSQKKIRDVDLSKFSSGIYYLRLINDNYNIIKKIIVQ